MNLWKFIQTKLGQKIDLMLMTVISAEGSSPGKPGFKMAVTRNKELMGSIGGGSMEYEMVELAFARLQENVPQPFLKTQLHSEGNLENKSGMICSGKAIIAFYPLTFKYKKNVDAIVHEIETAGHGAIRISNSSFEFIESKDLDGTFLANISDENTWEYFEKPGKLNRICIIGAGHVGLALSKIMKDLDFMVEIYDDRLGLNTFENNEFVNKKHKIDYHDIDSLIPEGDNVYAVIMTFGHLSDELVLGKLINKKFKYLGMLGSKTKVRKIFERIGFDPEKETDRKIYSPVGLPINSQTPAEIAISIAAEIIKIKNS